MNEEINHYLNPLLTQLMEDSFNTLYKIYNKGYLKKYSINDLEFFLNFINDAYEFYKDSPERINDLNNINEHIDKLIIGQDPDKPYGSLRKRFYNKR